MQGSLIHGAGSVLGSTHMDHSFVVLSNSYACIILSILLTVLLSTSWVIYLI